MKFTILSHAGLLVQSSGVSVVVDPWLIGSCYWRSWFNFPEPEPALIDDLAPDYIYLTHLHWDHFHGPSLRRFPRQTPVLVPRIPTMRMIHDLNYLGFSDVREIPHGEKVQLAPDFELHSFQFDPIATDSIAIFQENNTVLLNANDCKCFGLSLRQITKRFPRVDFALRSYSSANPFPYCIEGYEDDFHDQRTKEDYRDEFAAFMNTVGTRYAIPFASNHCFVHPQTRHFNSTAVMPDSVAASMAGTKSKRNEENPECVIMPPGSFWSLEEGFHIRDFDYGSQMDYVEMLSRRHAGKLAAQQEREASATGNFTSFREYFSTFTAALNWLLRWHLSRIFFVIDETERKRFWLVDFRTKQIAEKTAAAPNCLQITTPALVMNDCCRKRMFSAWTPSKRLRIRLGARKIGQARLLLGLLDLHEHDQLPLRRFFTRRSLSVWRRRWREPLSLLWAMIALWALRRPPKRLYGEREALHR